MSHPDPKHDRSNERVADSKFAPKKEQMAKKMPKRESLIERHNKAIAKRDAGKTKEQMSNDAFKSGRTSGRY